jgi:hypothetical protein
VGFIAAGLADKQIAGPRSCSQGAYSSERCESNEHQQDQFFRIFGEFCGWVEGRRGKSF